MQFFHELPRDLRYEVALTVHGGAAKKLPFFHGKDHVFISTVVPFLHQNLVKAFDVVYTKEDYADEMYFIIKGRVNLVLGKKNLCYKSFSKNMYFGEIELI